MRQIEILRGQVAQNKVEQANRIITIKATHQFGIKLVTENLIEWAINIPLHHSELEGEVALMLEADVEPAMELLKPADILDFALRQLKASKPNDRSNQDRQYQILITDLEKQLAYALVYLNVSL